MTIKPVFLLAIPLLAMLHGSPALAHAYLKTSNPLPGSINKHAPAALLLTFTEDLEVPFCTVLVTDPAGRDDAGQPQAVPGHPDQLRVPLLKTGSGEMTVMWHALSTDTHKTKGSFSFIVSP